MDAKIAANKVKSGLDNFSNDELLELQKALKDHSEYGDELVILNNRIESSLTKEDKEAQDIEYNLFDVKESDFKKNMSFWDEDFKEESLDKNDQVKLKEFNAILGRVKVEDDKLGLDRDTYIDRLIQASMLEAKFFNLGSPQVAKLKPQERNKKVFDDFINMALNKISAINISESIRPAQGKECDPRTSEYKAYIQEYNAKVKYNIGKIYSNKSDPIVVSAQGIITSCADTSSKANEFIKRLSEKFKGSQEVKRIQATVSKFDEGCKKVWKNRWDIAKAVVESVRKNKWQVGLGLAGSLAITGATIATTVTAGAAVVGTAAAAAPVAAVALPITLGYMAYSTATSWVAPILDEASALRKDAKTAGKRMGLLESLKQARKNKANDASYKRKAAVGTGFAVLGGGLIGASYAGIFSPVSDATTAVTQAVTARVISTVSRVAGSNTSLAVERHYAKKAYKEAPADKKEQLRKNLTSANTALAFGLFAGAIATYVGLSHAAHANDAAEVTNTAFDNASATPAVAEVVPEVDMSHMVDRLPDYNSGMGISNAQYNTLLRTRTSEDLIRMYNNLSPEVMENFPDMTKEELLYKYNRLDAFTKIVNARTGVSIDGAKRWHWDTEMKSLKAMLECDEKITVAEINSAKLALSHIQENGDYKGPGDHVRTDFYLKTIEGEPCPKDNVSYYAHGGSKAKVITDSIPPAKATPPVVTPVPVDTTPVVDTPPTVTPTPIDTTPKVVTAPVVVTPPVDTAPVVVEPVAPTAPTVTRYVPLTEEFNVKTEAEHMAILRSKGAVLAEDGNWYVPSKDGTGIEIELTKLSEKAIKNPDGTFNVRNAQQLLNSKKQR